MLYLVGILRTQACESASQIKQCICDEEARGGAKIYGRFCNKRSGSQDTKITINKGKLHKSS